ncbi:DUF262 domain-containing protein [Cellulosimicrobium funkei]
MTTRPELWTVGDLAAARRAPSASDSHIVRIPPFQRGVVWGETRQKELIASIGAGFPIGAMLLALTGHEAVTDGGKERMLPVYSLIDGLQRTTSLLNYLEEPLLRDPGDFLTRDVLAGLTERINDAFACDPPLSIDPVRRSIIEWMRTTRRPDVIAGFTPSRLLARIAADLQVEYTQSTMEQLEGPISELLAKIQSHTSIDHVQIPVLLYTGSAENLPEVFKRLNSQGAPLTKYQIFAASWSSDGTYLKSDDIRDAISERYEKIVENGYELADINADDLGDTVSLFDYLTGLGQVLARSAPLLFAETEPDTVQSLAFSMATLVAGRRLEDMANLPRFLKSTDTDEIDLTAFEEAARWACGFVEGQLRPILGFKLNSERAGSGEHSELQVVSMIVAAIVGRFDPVTWQVNPEWSEREPRLKKAIVQSYVVDIIRREWRGALYSLAFQRVWTEPAEKGSRATQVAPYYFSPLSGKQLEEQLRFWFAEEILKEQKERSRMSAADRLLLKVAYAHSMTYAQHESETLYEVDHIFPVKRLRDLIASQNDSGWPIGAIGNLALIPKEMNRRKRDETVPEFLVRAQAGSAPALKTAADVMEKMLFMQPAIFGIPSADGRDRLTKKEYLDRVRARWEVLQGIVVAALCE